MTSYAHKRILSTLDRIGPYPADKGKLEQWLEGEGHLKFVRDNATDDELILYASSNSVFVHTVAVPSDNLEPLQKSDLLTWSHNPFTVCASVWWRSGEEKHLGFERGITTAGSDSLDGGHNLVFMRSFEGWSDEPSTSIELLQEFEHTAAIRWRAERNAYCKFDENGDFCDVVSVTRREERHPVTLITAKQDELVEYLVASRQTLVQMFDFTLLNHDTFRSWGDGEEVNSDEDDQFFYRSKIVEGECAYHRGVQILKPRLSRDELLEKLTNPYPREERGVEFLAFDWRHGEVRKISTAPGSTTNYFQMADNDLPHELSMAFFRPEVLSKYKADRDKYTVGDRTIHCRSAWSMRGIDVNEAGQVHAYICDLADLPYQEQIHWQSYNIEPEAPISKRAFTNDFKGEWWTEPDPYRGVLARAREWDRRQVSWWTLKDRSLLDRTALPVTDNRGEWAEAFMDLTKLFNEGFVIKAIRVILKERSIDFDPKDQSLVLLEKLLASASDGDEPPKLNGLRMAQKIRSKVKGHAGSSEAIELAKDALANHETFARHVQHVSAEILEELHLIEGAFHGSEA